MEGGDTGGYSLPGQSLSSVGASFPYAGSHFQTWVVVLVRGWLSHGGGGGGLPWPVLVLGCHIAVSDMAPGFPVSKESGGGVCVLTVGMGWRCLPGAGHSTVTVRCPLMCHIVVVASH